MTSAMRQLFTVLDTDVILMEKAHSKFSLLLYEVFYRPSPSGCPFAFQDHSEMTDN
jgi:hypothetical protein